MKTYIALLLLISSLSLVLNIAHGEKILVITFFSSKSHKLTYQPLIDELGRRGHNVTVVSSVPTSGKEVPNVKEIFTYDVQKDLQGFNPFEMKEAGKVANPLHMISIIDSVCRKTYDLPLIKDLLNEKFDLIFIQPFFNDCVLGLVHRLDAPLVLFFPTNLPSFMAGKIGGHFPPSFTPNFFSTYPDDMNFVQRFINFGVTVFMEAVLRFYYEPKMTALYREKLGQDLPSAREILGNASLILNNGHFSLHKPKPYLPDVIDVGGIHSRPAKPIPKDLEDFISKSGKDGFIYFSMGTAIKGDKMTEAKRKMFIKAFSKLKQQVLWKWESETMPDLPKNVKLSKWLPQQDILGHPNIKLFITHCGGGSTEEAIYHGVPLIGLPMIGDQSMNAKTAKNHGFLIELQWTDFTEEQLSDAIDEVLNNPKYQDNVQRLSKIFKDQPTDPLERGVFWVEYVMRHKGAPHLRSAARKLNYFQYHSWDVIAVYFVFIFVLIRIIYASLKFILRKTCGTSEKKSKMGKNKKNK